MTADDPAAHAEPTTVASYATTGEAEVAQAKLRAYGIEAFLDDQIEGGSVPMEGEAGIVVRVRAADAADAETILSDTTPADEDDDDEAAEPT